MESLVSTSDEDRLAASQSVNSHLILCGQKAISSSIPFLRPTGDRAWKQFTRAHHKHLAKQGEEVGQEFFDVSKRSKGHSIRFSISRAQQEVGGKIRKVVGSVRNSNESNRRGKSISSPIMLEDLQEGKQSRFEDSSKLASTYSNLSSLGLITSRASSTSSLSSIDSTTVPPTPESIPATPAPSFYMSPFNNSSPFTSPIAGPVSPRINFSPSFPPDFTPPSRTLTLDGITTSPRKETRIGFNPSRRLSIKPKDFQKMLHSRRKKHGSKIEVDEDDILAKALIEIGVAVEEKEEFVMDVLFEHQRGAVIFGLPKFSANLLNQFDPTAWVNGKLKSSPFNAFNHPLPSPFWKWTHSEWLVDMSRDVDEQGWSYSTRFRSLHWHAEPDAWRSFVRRRRWIRGRVFIPKVLPTPINSRAIFSKNQIDWESLRPEEKGDGEITGIKKAVSLLPISSQRKDDVYAFDAMGDVRDPFLSWALIKLEGESIMTRSRSNHSSKKVIGEDSTGSTWEVWKQAVIEINLRRVVKVLQSCRLDREKFGIWSWWLGQEIGLGGGGYCPLFLDRLLEEEEDKTAEERESDIGKRHIELLELSGRRRSEIGKRPSLDDVLDLIEFRLDPILALFEFQSTRLSLLRLLLKLHSTTHSPHNSHHLPSPHLFAPSALRTKGITPRIGLGFYNDIIELEKVYSTGITSGN